MKYTDEQKAIINTCGKYKGVKVEFGIEKFCIYTNDGGHKFSLTDNVSEIEEWLKTNCELKQVGRPKGSIKPSRKVKRILSLTKEADEQLIELARQRNASKSAVVNSAIGCLHNIEIMWNDKE